MGNVLVRGYEEEPNSFEEERLKNDNKKSIKRDLFSIIRGRGLDISDLSDMRFETY